MQDGGEGGMLCTPDLDLHKRCWAMAQHGKDFDESAVATARCDAPASPPTETNNSSFRWLVRHTGTNLRMTEMQAAIGLCQLRKLRDWSAARRRNSLIMQDALRSVHGLRVPRTPDGHAHYRCVAFTVGVDAPAHRDACLRALHAAGVPAMHGSCAEIYQEPFFQRSGLTPAACGRGQRDAAGRLPVARQLGETSLTFLCHHTIDEPTMRDYAAAVRGCLTGVA